MYFNGNSNQNGFGVGSLLVSPEEAHTLISIKLDFEVINNTAEYEAYIIKLKVALDLGVKSMGTPI